MKYSVKTHRGAADGRPSAEYLAWRSLRARCTRTYGRCHKTYRARGINFCDRWDSFDNFYSDMGARPPGMTLDRIDNNKGYSPENCRWTTNAVQQTNRSNNRILEIDGVRKCIAEWSRDPMCVVTHACLALRIYAGWGHRDALVTPSAKAHA